MARRKKAAELLAEAKRRVVTGKRNATQLKALTPVQTKPKLEPYHLCDRLCWNWPRGNAGSF